MVCVDALLSVPRAVRRLLHKAAAAPSGVKLINNTKTRHFRPWHQADHREPAAYFSLLLLSPWAPCTHRLRQATPLLCLARAPSPQNRELLLRSQRATRSWF